MSTFAETRLRAETEGFSPAVTESARPEGRTPCPSLDRGAGFVGLNLGREMRAVPGWTNCDSGFGTLSFRLGRFLRLPRYRRLAGLRCVGIDARKPLPFPSESVHAVYEQHLLCAFAPEETQKFLTECCRVLCPGGVVRLNEDDVRTVAVRCVRGDLDAVDYVTREGDAAVELIEDADESRQTLAEFVSREARRAAGLDAPPWKARDAASGRPSSLRWLYDGESLAAHLHFAGFGEIEFKGFRESRLPDIEAIEQDTQGSVLGQNWIEAVKRET